MVLRDGDLHLKLIRLHERHDGLAGCDDLPFLRVNLRDDAVCTGCQVRVAECVVPLRSGGERLLVRRKGRVVIGLVLVEHRGRDSILLVELTVAREVALCQVELRPGLRDLRVAGIRLLHDVLGVDDHQRVARPDAAALLHIAREDLAADLEGEVRLIAAAHRASIRARVSLHAAAGLLRLDERRLLCRRRLLAAAGGRERDNEREHERQSLTILHDRSPLSFLPPVYRAPACGCRHGRPGRRDGRIP